MKNVRIAAVVMNSPVGEIRGNLDRMIRWIQKAIAKGADIICFPELSLTGYCNQKKLAQIALAVDCPAVAELKQCAIEQQVVILTGLAEKNPQGRIFASHLAVLPSGHIGRYRKLHLAPPEKKIFAKGDSIPIFEAKGMRFGIQLCYDAHFPGLSTHMAEEGVEVIFIPHASPRGDAVTKHQSWTRHLPARAYDNSVFIVACNQFGENCNGLTFPGNAVIYGPSGKVIAKATDGKEGLLMADLKAKDLEAVRGHDMRYFFPNRRPELYG